MNFIRKRLSQESKSKLVGLYQVFRLIQLSIFDLIQLIKHSGILGVYRNEKTMQYRMAMIYHGLEKGLSLPDVRLSFGRDKLVFLMGLVADYEKKGYDQNAVSYLAALNALRAYYNFHKDLDSEIKLEKLSKFLAKRTPPTGDYTREGGVFSNPSCDQNFKDSFDDFFQSRYSVRNYSERTVDTSALADALKVAQKTPSVCNRQSFHAFYTVDRSKIDNALSFQSGNRGWGHQVPALIVITADLAGFFSPGERNQPFIDGGLFSMSVMLALHARGLSSCALNCSMLPANESGAKQCLSIPNSMRLIMMISVGYARDGAKVACSPRVEAARAAIKVEDQI